MMESRWEGWSDDESAGTAASRFVRVPKWAQQPDASQEWLDPVGMLLDRGDGRLAANLEYVVKRDSGLSHQMASCPANSRRCARP